MLTMKNLVAFAGMYQSIGTVSLWAWRGRAGFIKKSAFVSRSAERRAPGTWAACERAMHRSFALDDFVSFWKKSGYVYSSWRVQHIYGHNVLGRNPLGVRTLGKGCRGHGINHFTVAESAKELLWASIRWPSLSSLIQIWYLAGGANSGRSSWRFDIC